LNENNRTRTNVIAKVVDAIIRRRII